MLSRGSSSFSVLVHLRGLELTADWFEYQIRETWIHSWSRLISLFRDVQSVRCMAISFTYHLRSYMHKLHRGHFQYGALVSSGRFHQSSSGHEFILVAIDYFTKWVEAANKNIKRILRKMVETSRDWS